MSEYGGDQQWQQSSGMADELRAERERRQRMFVVGLASVGGLVLVIGLLAFLLTRGDGGDAAAPTTAPVDTVPATSIVDPAPTSVAASTTTSTSSTTSTTTTTTIPVPDAVDAGPDLLASAGTVVTLSAADVGAETPDDFVRWVQTGGPDVTAGVGALGGPTVSFTAPGVVGQVTFDLVVVDPSVGVGDEDAADPEAPAVSDGLVVRVVENADTAVFVDLERGDDAAPGTIDAPLRTLAAASTTGADLYVRSVGRHDLTGAPITLGDGVDLYGGYDESWFRDPSRRVVIDGAAIAIVVTGEEDRVIASIELVAADAAPGAGSTAIAIDGTDVRVEDSRIVAGSAGPGTAEERNGSASIGIDARNADGLEIIRSTVNGGPGGGGWSGPSDAEPRGPAASGATAGGRAGAAGAGEGRVAGGSGGSGAILGNGDDTPGGGSGGSAGDPDGGPGRGGAGGAGGPGGDGARSADGDRLAARGAIGAEGDVGESGVGGGGGGGGFGLLTGVGGGGGAGGLGGQPGGGGAGGGGGGGSLGVRAVDVADVVIIESLVAGAAGGGGGVGGVGGSGEPGGEGGAGAEGAGFPQGGGAGGGGGGGGGAGAGGRGGGGSGGPSVGLLTSDVTAVTLVSSEIRSGNGGGGASGGGAGADGTNGDPGAGDAGGGGGTGGIGTRAEDPGRGADGGASVAWWDLGDAQQDVADSTFTPGNGGPGGPGAPRGDDGPRLQVA